MKKIKKNIKKLKTLRKNVSIKKKKFKVKKNLNSLRAKKIE
jgi:hypothetical protein